MTLRQTANTINITQDIEVKRKIVPERFREFDSVINEIATTIEFIPGSVEQLRVKKLVGVNAEIISALVYNIGSSAQFLVVVLGFITIEGVNVKARHDKIKVMGCGALIEMFEHVRLTPVIAIHEVDKLTACLT